jgi:hypothetical protein
MIFLAFESYDKSRSGAETEATLVVQQVEMAQFLPQDKAAQLTGELVCYRRSVAGVEWAALDSGTLGNAINPWARRCSTRSDRSNRRRNSRPRTGGWMFFDHPHGNGLGTLQPTAMQRSLRLTPPCDQQGRPL